MSLADLDEDLVAGIDGCPGGWVGILLRSGRFERAVTERSLQATIGALGRASAIGVDIPIGLPEREPRACDLAARARLLGRAATVFITPPRAVLGAADLAAANERCRALTGRGVSAQAFALAPRILEADRLAATDRRLREVHPELSFAAMAGGPIVETKASWNGAQRRARLLADHGIGLPEDLGDARSVPVDDVLDAAAAAWTAWRVARRVAERLPPGESGPAIWI